MKVKIYVSLLPLTGGFAKTDSISSLFALRA